MFRRLIILLTFCFTPLLSQSIPLIEIDAEDTENIIHIDAKARAIDYEEAFRELYRQDPTAKIYAIVDGKSLDNIVNVQAMPEQTLVIFTIATRHRTFQQVAKTEEIEEFGTRGSTRSKIMVHFPNSNNQD